MLPSLNSASSYILEQLSKSQVMILVSLLPILVLKFCPCLLNIILGSRWNVAKFSISVSMVTAPTLNPVSSVISLSNTCFVSVLLRLVLI
jgi:predicted membrane channel-forming protein YqfA (hemolysin III family)